MSRHAPYLREMGLVRWRYSAPAPGEHGSAAAGSAAAAGIQPQGARKDLARLADEVARCERCDLHSVRRNVVFGAGDARARWLFVGEAPGAEEDKQGLPFVGRAGSLLNAILFSIGLSRDEVYIANVLKCRPPNNRDPFGREVQECSPYLQQQISLAQPEIIVAMGRFAAQALLETDQSLAQLRGRVHQYKIDQLPLVVTYPPAYLLRSPSAKGKSWEDLRLACSVMS
ncbi:MAG: uracil-DNA glycosylase [Acidiferrobacteraceae bacterium]|nr:uracil-DNA glycosylase [Acidiferrobacteraceae bacterium]